MSAHRWSGWPGAWCLDCGIDDPCEQAAADGELWFEYDDEGEPKRTLYKPGVEERLKLAMICPEPGSKRHDPYAKSLMGPDEE